MEGGDTTTKVDMNREGQRLAKGEKQTMQTGGKRGN